MRRGREFWVSTVAEFERRQLTQKSFAQRRGIALATLQWGARQGAPGAGIERLAGADPCDSLDRAYGVLEDGLKDLGVDLDLHGSIDLRTETLGPPKNLVGLTGKVAVRLSPDGYVAVALDAALADVLGVC